jgi:uncharacterized protein (DUF2252 family)
MTEFKGRKPGARVSVVDAAYWMKGCSSLGRLRYTILLGVGKKSDRSYCLIDLKEAASAVIPQSTMAVRNNAQRVVTGACALAPNLGQRMLAVKLEGKDLVMRELMPQDLKFDLDCLTQEEAVAAALYLAGVVGKAPGRQMNAKTRSSRLVKLKKQHSKNLDAPSWSGPASSHSSRIMRRHISNIAAITHRLTSTQRFQRRILRDILLRRLCLGCIFCILLCTRRIDAWHSRTF